MPEVKDIIREMLQRGMSEEEILSTLRDIGIDNPDAIYKDALAAFQKKQARAAASTLPQRLTPPAPAPAPRAAAPEEEGARPPAEELLFGEKRVVEEREVAAPEGGAAEGVSSASAAALDAKLDEALALLKTLQDLNKKILEANRDILLRLRK